MSIYKRRIVLAIDDRQIRERIRTSLVCGELPLHVLESSNALRHFAVSDTDFILLETGNDAAALVQIVYELYKKLGVQDYTLPIIAIASREVIRCNPALALWLIDNHAAALCLLATEDIDYDGLPDAIKALDS